jgi:predicted GNAT family acetyltransferase
VLADARKRGLKVKATCPFIAAYLKKHQDAAESV